MNKSNYIYRFLALILAIVLIIPTAVYAVDENEEEPVPEAVPEVELTAEEPEAPVETPEEPAEVPEAVTEIRTEEEPAEPIPAAGGSEITDKDQTEDGQDEPEDPADPVDPTEPEEPEEPEEPGIITNLKAEENPMGTVDLKWDSFKGAAYYTTVCPQVKNGKVYKVYKCAQTFTKLGHGVVYDFIIAAYDAEGKLIAQSAVSLKTVAYKINYRDSYYRKLRTKTITPKKYNLNLRTMIKEPNSGYAVVQGGCTDGTYAYYLMVSSKTQWGRVLKVKMSTNRVVARSRILNTWHGNGMAFDRKRNKLVVIARGDRKQQITQIDAKTLRITKQRNARYSYAIDAGSAKLSARYKQSGLGAIAYVRKYDCYIAFERVHHNLLIFDPDTFECIGLAYTNLGSANPGTFQGMDADGKYVYLLLSYYDRSQPYNKIVAVDWNSENLLPVVNATKSKDPKYVKKAWFCANDGSGRPDASIYIRTRHEAENIYHWVDKSGKCHFYMSEYYGHRVKSGKKVYYKRDNYLYYLGII